MFLIDTDVISRTSPSSVRLGDVQGFLDRHWGESYLSTLTLGELWFGASRLRLRGAVRKATQLSAWVSDVEHTYSGRLLSVDVAIGRRTGEMLARAEANGHQAGYVDACLAATAAEFGYTVVTFNVRHFVHFGVPHRTPLPAQDAP